MHGSNDKEKFKGEKEWDLQNKGEGGGQVLAVKGARFDDHSDTAKRIRERKRQSEQKEKDNPSGSVSR
ncbi:hypothetical protein [Wolbachia pipientis]|uniref:hypothetical protein n=1 Tax=Wolbachia pipientis TaxID=955 RepID=UPI0025A32C95|nr:hypothetical protein [Wolbachia pipientis]MDM8335075.1 hypothetical protein [Wolbachia pipientis]